MSATTSGAYPGWIFRLNIPNGRSANTNSSSTSDGVDGCDTLDEGVQLLQKNAPVNNDGYGLSSSPPPSSSSYLAELCPHGVTVATLSGDGKNQTSKQTDQATPITNSTETKWSWSYSSQSSPSQWNVTSSKLLSVTYRPAHEAYPSYTNISMKREYWHKSVGTCLEKGASCTCGKCSKRAGTGGHAKNAQPRKRRQHRWGKLKRRITGAPKPIHRVKVSYKVEDIMFMEPVVASEISEPGTNADASGSGVWIRGIGNCHALRIYLRPKFGTLANGSNTVSGENEIVANNAESELHPMEKWDSIPSPPWDNENSKGGVRGDKVDTDQKNVKHWGPIITFAIPCQSNGDAVNAKALQKCPPLLWKVDHPPNPHVALDSFLLMDGALHLHTHKETKVDQHSPSSTTSSMTSYDYDTPTNVYIHGYQSWSFSGSVVQGEAQPKSAMPNLFSAAFNRGGMVLSGGNAHSGDNFDGDHWNENIVATQVNNESEHIEEDELNEATAFYKSDMFACISSNGATSSHDNERILLDEEGGPALIVGFIAQRHQYGAVLLDKDLRHFNLYACHEGVVAKRTVTSDWAYCQIVDANCFDEEAMVYYVHATGDHNEARPMEKGLTCGWCSWYHYYSDIDHDSLSRNAHILEKSKSSIGFNVCLIDDGYMTAWGDWTSLKPGKFVKDGGMRVLADAIRSKGMSPGVWLAPFACDKSSNLAKDHPDWIIRNDMGRYANSANCGKFFYGLDATNPAVRKHVYDTIRRAVEEWGFEVLKLDFLYACCLMGNGKFDPSLSRADAMYLGLRTIRAAAGNDTFIIGCGCPIGSAVGFVDGMRVSCDTGPTFVPEFPLPHWDNGTLPALRGMLRNTMSRAPLGHRWWHNDPDCILLGELTKLTNDEVVSAASIVAMTGGMFLLSDDMEKVSEKRLSVAKRIFPLTGVTAVPLDLHSTINGGMPSILRLWCAEKTTPSNNTSADEIDIISSSESSPSKILHEQASKLEFEVGYSPGNTVDPYSRERSCFSVASGLGSWTVVSLSNWLDHSARLSVSFSALVSHSIDDFVAMGAPRSVRSLAADNATPGEMSEHGFHCFSFWKSEYVWIPHQTLVDNNPLIKKLKPHETEIFHLKAAEPTRPQYIGSDLHFSCGFEVASFDWSVRDHVRVCLKNDYKRKGSIFVYLPESKGLDKAAITVNGAPAQVEIVARPSFGDGCEGRVIRVDVTIEGSGVKGDGVVLISLAVK
ncbi:hypothetical protein ACHAXR_010246 [Thalassiosira sp. AJA248-18]